MRNGLSEGGDARGWMKRPGKESTSGGAGKNGLHGLDNGKHDVEQVFKTVVAVEDDDDAHKTSRELGKLKPRVAGRADTVYFFT